jgi:hypothetical protein
MARPEVSNVRRGLYYWCIINWPKIGGAKNSGKCWQRARVSDSLNGIDEWPQGGGYAVVAQGSA